MRGEVPSTAGRNAARLAGLGVVAVLALAALSWRSLGVQWHLFRLREEPERLEQFAASSEGTLERAALEAFLRGPHGKSALVRAFLAGLESPLSRERGFPDSFVSGFVGVKDLDGEPEARAWMSWRDRAGEPHQLGFPAPAKLAGLLGRAVHHEAVLRANPSLRFRLLSVEDAAQRYLEGTPEHWKASGPLTGYHPFAFLVTREE